MIGRTRRFGFLASAGVILAGLILLPVAWIQKGVDVQLEIETSEPMTVQIFYGQSGQLSEADSIVKRIVSKRDIVRFRLPIDEMKRLRIDFGDKPAAFKVHPIEIIGREHVLYAWQGGEARHQLDQWKVDAEGCVLAKSDGRDPNVTLFFNPVVRSWLAFNWKSACLVALLAGFLFWKLSHLIVPCISLIAPDGRVFAFDALRVLALVTVVISHVVMHTGTPGWCSTVGVFGVSLFIFISGAGLSLGDRELSWWKFMRQRLAAILPTYWTAYLVIAVFVFLFRQRLKFGSDPLLWLLTIFGLDGFLFKKIPTDYALIGEWYVGFVLLLYMIAPFVLFGLRKAPLVVCFLACCISGVAFGLNDILSKSILIVSPNVWWNPLVRLPEFVFGYLFVKYLIDDRRHLLVAAACAVPVAAFSMLIRGDQFFNYSYVSIGGFAALFVIICTFLAFVRTGEPMRKIIGFLAKYSFVAFLAHHQVIWFVLDKCSRKSNWSRDIYCILVILSTLLISYLLAWLICRPADVVRGLVFGEKPKHKG